MLSVWSNANLSKPPQDSAFSSNPVATQDPKKSTTYAVKAMPKISSRRWAHHGNNNAANVAVNLETNVV